MEVLAESLKGLPEMVDIRLQKLKSMDRYSRDLLNKLNEEEKDTLEYIITLRRKSDPAFGYI